MRCHADAILGRALAHPADWTGSELHVEIETYTWDVLPGAARGPGALVDGLEREYAHVLDLSPEPGGGRPDGDSTPSALTGPSGLRTTSPTRRP
ncbi:MAG: hypothetical protein GY711_17245 [bacterium]|nr:hypothetical protein [bacterium]